MKRQRQEMARTSLESTVVSQPRDSSQLLEDEDGNDDEQQRRGSSGSDESESGWTTYLDHHNAKNNGSSVLSSSPPPPLPLPLPLPPVHKRRRRSLARQDSTLSVLSDASSGPARDHSPCPRFRSVEQAGEKKSLVYEDNESDIDNNEQAAFEAIERQLRVLQRLIPDGNKFRDEEMLDKAIEYVHCLQRKIQIFESRREDLQERGLCLIPVSMFKLI